MSNYKDTLNLPNTDFPMKANLAKREPEFLAAWQEQNLYQKIQSHGKGRPSFVFHDGPPYANGPIHLGHALNKTLKDFVIKSKTISGFSAPFIPGWDCHGLPIELIVEKKYGKANDKISAKTFREKCREYAQSQMILQREGFKRLGLLADWENPYMTMNYQYEANIIRAFSKIISRGHLQQGFKPVYWCLDCHSSLAEAEVEYRNKTSPSIDVRFKVVDPNDVAERLQIEIDNNFPLTVPIWTTTPWTLPGNQAVAIHPELNYVLIKAHSKQGDEYFILAESLLNSCVTRFGLSEHHVISTFLGERLNEVKVKQPLSDREVPIVMGNHVTTDTGTGCVHTAPGHGPDDYVVALQYDLPISNPIDDNGCFNQETAFFAGLHVNRSNEPIIEQLLLQHNLIHFDTIEHSYPHCWRHKTATIFRATPQWFISMDKENLRQDALKAIEQVSWVPDWGKERIAGMVDGRPDWCISRQRYWGTPITLLIHKETKELHPDTLAIMEKVALLVEQSGIEAWFDCEVQDLIDSDADRYQKATDTLDVWFDSGVSHFSVIAQHNTMALPANLYLEGSDQHRGWFQSSLLTAIAMYGTAPYLEVLTHGFTVDEHGYKMSKSRGNVIAPDTIINKYGADILRLWVAASDYRTEPSLSDEILKRVSDVYRRVRNTARFLLANLFDFEPEAHLIPTQSLLPLDQYIIARAAICQQEIIEAYENYQFHLVYQKIHHFCSIELGSFYLDIIKDRQYTCYKESLARRSCQNAMYHILQALVRWLAPILTFTAEEIWKFIPNQQYESVFMATWYDGLVNLPKDSEFDHHFWSQVINIRDEVNKHLEASRKSGDIGSPLAAEITLYLDTTLKVCLDKLGDECRFIFITSDVILHPYQEKPVNIPESEVAGLGIHVHSSSHEKCNRCWHRRSDVGAHELHPELCGRCVSNLTGPGEVRHYA